MSLENFNSSSEPMQRRGEAIKAVCPKDIRIELQIRRSLKPIATSTWLGL